MKVATIQKFKIKSAEENNGKHTTNYIDIGKIMIENIF